MFAEKAVTESEYRTSWHLFPIFNLNVASLSASLFKKDVCLVSLEYRWSGRWFERSFSGKCLCISETMNE